MKPLKQQLLTLLFLAAGLFVSAQVGVGTTSPTTTLDVVGANHTTVPGALAASDGVTAPRVTTDMTATPAAGVTVGQIVYSTHASSTGFYYWNGSAWIPLVPAPSTFTVGSGGVLTVTLNGSNHDFSSNTTNNSFHITPTSGFGNDAITLPNPANNVGRIIVIKNVGGKGISVTNAYDDSTPVISTRCGIYISDGVHWVNTQN